MKILKKNMMKNFMGFYGLYMEKVVVVQPHEADL